MHAHELIKIGVGFTTIEASILVGFKLTLSREFHIVHQGIPNTQDSMTHDGKAVRYNSPSETPLLVHVACLVVFNGN